VNLSASGTERVLEGMSDSWRENGVSTSRKKGMEQNPTNNIGLGGANFERPKNKSGKNLILATCATITVSDGQ
jgi:hypothetical protein